MLFESTMPLFVFVCPIYCSLFPPFLPSFGLSMYIFVSHFILLVILGFIVQSLTHINLSSSNIISLHLCILLGFSLYHWFQKFDYDLPWRVISLFFVLILCQSLSISWARGFLEHICSICNKCVTALVCEFHRLCYFWAWSRVRISCSSACLEIVYRTLDVVDCTLWRACFCLIPLKNTGPRSGRWWSYLQISSILSRFVLGLL